MTTPQELETTICKLVPLMREAVDMSIHLRQQGEEEHVTAVWEEFLSEFLRYSKRQGDQCREDLFADLNMARLLGDWRSLSTR